MSKLTPEQIAIIRTTEILNDNRNHIRKLLGSEYLPTVRQYYKSIRFHISRLNTNCVGVASIIGNKLVEENKNPLIFLAACVEFGIENPKHR